MSPAHLVDRLRNRRPGLSLDREFYVDADVFRSDLEAVWYRDWVFVGHIAEVPDDGDFMTLAIGDYQLVIVRDDCGVVRALHNVCRHRGSLLCSEERGTVRRRFVCPYHQWAYELDGRLAKHRRTPDGFDPAEHGLGTVACAVVAGMIFVSLAADPPDFSPMDDLVGRYLAPFRLDRAKVAASTTSIEAANWKLVVENNRECLHCRSAHPELCTTFPEAPVHAGGATGDDLIALNELADRAEALGLPSEYAIAVDHQFRAMRMPLVGDARSLTMDGEPAVARRFGDLPADDLGDVLLYHYPSTWNHFLADHAVTFRLLPIDATHTRLTTTWLVPPDAVAGTDYDVDHLTSVWNATNVQDASLVERAQLGVASPAYRPGPYSPEDEVGVAQFVDWYCDRMLAANAPH